jgi:hypothetical protein
MKPIEFSDMTNRLHRNMTAAAAIIIGIKLFDLKIEKAGTLGIEIKNFTTGVLVTILMLVLIYNAIAYALRVWEEYRRWQLQLTEKQIPFLGAIGMVDLSNDLYGVSLTLKKITADTDAIRHQGQDVFTKADADALNAVTKAAQTYAKGFKNFPWIARFRFWGWDIGMAAILTVVALLFAFSLLPTPPRAFLWWRVKGAAYPFFRHGRGNALAC